MNTMELPVSDERRRRTSSSSSYKLETKHLTCKITNTKYGHLNWPSFCSSYTPNRPFRYILQDVNCEAMPGEITAIAGPSGAGKTTLLEVLAGKVSGGKFSGQVLINQSPIEPKWYKRISGYVTQDDALFPNLTVHETLMYSALLRLQGGRREALGRVKVLLKELGLDQVASSRVGEGSNSGISGGERRRVSIGVELVHDPSVVLIDEPTSGLDSASALQVMALLKSLAMNQAKTIVVTIHQPGFRILELVNRIVLLSNGVLIHNGSLQHLEEKLKFSRYRVPPRINVLEFSIDVIGGLVKGYEGSREEESNHRMITFEDNNKLSYPNSRIEEVGILGQRFCKNVFRTKQLFATRVIQALVAGLLLGTIFMNVGNDNKHVALQTRIGFFAFTLTFLLSSTTEGLPIFLQERGILERETSRGAYRVSSYVIANTLVFLPFLLLICLLYTSTVYWLVGLRGDIFSFLYFNLVVWMVLLMSNSFTACFSALVPNFIMGTSVIAGLMGSFFLFSGYFVSKENMPDYWIFMHYLSLFRYPFECFMVNEYGGVEGRRRCVESDESSGGCNLYGDGFLRQQGLEDSQKWSNLVVMLGFILGYRVMCLLILWIRCYRNRK